MDLKQWVRSHYGMLKQTHDTVELRVCITLSKSVIAKVKDEAGNVHQVEGDKFVKHMKILQTFYKSDLTGLSQYITTRNSIAKKRCIVFDRATQRHYTVSHSYEELCEAVHNKKANKVGFTK